MSITLDSSIKDIITKIDYIHFYKIKGKFNNSIEDDEDEELDLYNIQRNNRLFEQCVERCLAENFSFEGWQLTEVPYGDENGAVFVFYNNSKSEGLDMFSYYGDDEYGGYAIPLLNTEQFKNGANQFGCNTISKAIYKPINKTSK